MKKLAVVTLLALSTVATAQKAGEKGKPVTIKVPPLPPSTNDLLFGDPARAAWTPVDKMGYPPGAQMALIGQDPVSTGPTVYMKTPGGYKLPAHWHTHGEHIYFISGRANLIIDGKVHELQPGSYASLPPKQQHVFECAAGAECLFVTERAGPADVNWVKK